MFLDVVDTFSFFSRHSVVLQFYKTGWSIQPWVPDSQPLDIFHSDPQLLDFFHSRIGIYFDFEPSIRLQTLKNRSRHRGITPSLCPRWTFRRRPWRQKKMAETRADSQSKTSISGCMHVRKSWKHSKKIRPTKKPWSLKAAGYIEMTLTHWSRSLRNGRKRSADTWSCKREKRTWTIFWKWGKDWTILRDVWNTVCFCRTGTNHSVYKC